MRTVAGTLGQAVILLVLASAIGLGANALRATHNRIPIRDYVVPPVTPTTTTATKTATAPEFQEISLADTYALYNDPGGQPGVGQFVFVDARNDEHFQAGHIPGAIHCDPWHIEDCTATLLSSVSGAEKIIVYCTGGTCEDSLHMCRRLIEFSIPRERIYLFRGGWDDWSKNNYPTATGPQ